jgi:hypothetical protein
MVSKLSEIWFGMFIPDPDLDFINITDPGSRGQRHRIPGSKTPDPGVKDTGSRGQRHRIPDPDPHTDYIRYYNTKFQLPAKTLQNDNQGCNDIVEYLEAVPVMSEVVGEHQDAPLLQLHVVHHPGLKILKYHDFF